MGEPEPLLHIVLYQPQIPPNTGNAGRLCLGIGARLHVVHPIPFQMDAKAVRRAGLDYWKHVDCVEHTDDSAFWSWADGRRVHLYSSGGAASHASVTYALGDVLVFGCEATGLPEHVLTRQASLRIPMTGPIRSLNLSNAVAVVAYRALADLRPDLF